MDVFAGNGFTMQSLMARLLDQPYVPRQVQSLGIFAPRGISTTSLFVEKQGATLQLVPVTPRNAPAVQNVKDPRSLVTIPSVRIAMEDTITADEVQNVRALFSESDLGTVVAETDRRILRMDRSVDATEEFQRLGALKGQIIDADGSSVLIDLFVTFGVSAQSEVGMDLSNATPAAGVLRSKCASIQRLIAVELGGIMFDTIHAFCSASFFDALVSHPEYRQTYLNWPDAASLRTPQAYRIATFGGITFEEYRGQIGSVKFIADDKAIAFPVGAAELFVSAYAPAEYNDTVNTPGVPRYVRINPDGVDPQYKRTFRVQSHPVHICTRPRTLIPMRLGA